MKDGPYLEPVQAYGHIAPAFAALSERRRAYLAAIENLVIAAIPRGSASLLDVGAGDGTRTQRIARASGLSHLALLEPSAPMRAQWPEGVESWPIRAEQLAEKTASFDVIICLWNVLGHIFPAESRVAVLRECARLLSPQGRMFVDVNYRYNAWHYGLLPTLFRALSDHIYPPKNRGDVIVHWSIEGATYQTKGHVFTHAEFRRIAQSAGLLIEKMFTVNYATGRLQGWRFAGNPLYVLRPGNELGRKRQKPIAFDGFT